MLKWEIDRHVKLSETGTLYTLSNSISHKYVQTKLLYFRSVPLYIYIYIYIYIYMNISSSLSSSSSCGANTNFLESLSPFVPIIYRSQQVFQTTSCVCTELLLISSCGSTNTATLENITCEFVLAVSLTPYSSYTHTHTHTHTHIYIYIYIYIYMRGT